MCRKCIFISNNSIICLWIAIGLSHLEALVASLIAWELSNVPTDQLTTAEFQKQKQTNYCNQNSVTDHADYFGGPSGCRYGSLKDISSVLGCHRDS